MTRARHSSLELPTPEPSGEPGGECQLGKPDDLTSSTVGVCGSTHKWEKPASTVPVTRVNGRDPVCAAGEHAEKLATWLTRVGRARSEGGGVLPAPELATRLRPSAPEVLIASHDLPLGVLTQKSRDSLAPSGDIRATLEWGYYPLTDAERVVFERLNAAGGWTRQAADTHCLLHNPLVLGAAFAAGRAMGREEAMRLARQAGGDAVPPGERTITAREREVAVLIAKGLSNQQIAEHLVIAPSTANRHVANILCKLGFSSRARIATWVTERRVHGHGFRAAS